MSMRIWILNFYNILVLFHEMIKSDEIFILTNKKTENRKMEDEKCKAEKCLICFVEMEVYVKK